MPFARLATIVALLTLAGCAAHPSRPAAVPPQAATGSPSPARAGDPPDLTAGSGDPRLDRFVAAVHQTLPAVTADRRDEEVEDLGTQACEALGRNHDTKAAATALRARGLPPASARTLVTLAHQTLCHP